MIFDPKYMCMSPQNKVTMNLNNWSFTKLALVKFSDSTLFYF